MFITMVEWEQDYADLNAAFSTANKAQTYIKDTLDKIGATIKSHHFENSDGGSYTFSAGSQGQNNVFYITYVLDEETPH